MARVNIPVDLEWADDLAEMTANRDHWKARAERAEAEAAQLRADLDAALGVEYEIHTITGSTSAGRRQRDAGKARRSDEDQL